MPVRTVIDKKTDNPRVFIDVCRRNWTVFGQWGGGGGGNRTRVRRTSANKDYVRIRSVIFRERNVRTGRSARPLFPWFRSRFREINPNLSRCVTPQPVFTGKNGETWLSKQPELTDCQQLYLISTIFTSRGQLDTPLQPLDPRRIRYTPITLMNTSIRITARIPKVNRSGDKPGYFNGLFNRD